ncbi:MAG TPA: cytochrome P450 [Segeticoccus sp.]|uniref:cytochrome P450 n=1 Tax=Segeticoccus sp. TaxID=2706531 RepID=UPI002D7FDC0E|nr:cytochrome P450 [Segeticoccus sp.]HET8601446.1 cytochrome P450 [Segeticoccus sp.]
MGTLGIGAVKRWGGRRAWGKVLSGENPLLLRVLPRSFFLPLQRRGLDPVPEWTERADTAPVHRWASVLGMRLWLATGYDEVRSVLADTDRYSNDVRQLVRRTEATGSEAIGGLGFTDPPDHTRLRRYLTPEFTRRRLARLEPRIEQIVHEQLDTLERAAEGDAPIDLVSGFAFPVPFRVICELLGLSMEECEQFRTLGQARFDFSGGARGLLGAAAPTREFLIGVAARQRQRPGEGLIGSLVRSHGDELDDVELGGLADGLFLGGYETSASMLALGTMALLQDPAQYAALCREPDDVERLVEELLRYLSVVQVAFPRFARVDHELGGQRIRAGDAVVCSLAAANHAEQFGPTRQRLDTQRVGPPGHLAFGHGPHRCVGAELARAELRIAFRALVGRFPHLSLAADPAELQFRPTSIVYGLESLPVRLGQPSTNQPPFSAATARA